MQRNNAARGIYGAPMDYDLNEFLDEYDDYTRQVIFAKLSLFPSRLSQWFDLMDSGEETVGRHIAWLEKQFDWERKKKEVMPDDGSLKLPVKKIQRLSAQLNLFRAIDKGDIDFTSFAHEHFYNGRSAQAAVEKFTSQLFEPFTSELRRYIERYFDEEIPDNLEAETRPAIPAANRIVTLNHNAPEYTATLDGLEGIEDQIRTSNALPKEDRDRSLVELTAVKEILKQETARIEVLKGFVLPTLIFLSVLLVETVAGAAISNTILPSLKALMPAIFGP